MKKIIVGIVALTSITAVADELCGQTWKSQNRFYVDGKDGLTDTEVLIPAHASKEIFRHFRNEITSGCLQGKLVNVGAKEVFIAVDL